MSRLKKRAAARACPPSTRRLSSRMLDIMNATGVQIERPTATSMGTAEGLFLLAATMIDEFWPVMSSQGHRAPPGPTYPGLNLSSTDCWHSHDLWSTNEHALNDAFAVSMVQVTNVLLWHFVKAAAQARVKKNETYQRLSGLLEDGKWLVLEATGAEVKDYPMMSSYCKPECRYLDDCH